MNNDTVTLIERPYLEIVDDILTAIVGGVVNEPIIFDVKMDLYPLAEPALDVRGITGTARLNGEPEHYVFQKEVDFVFSNQAGGESAVIWLPAGRQPDDETTFYVDYFRQASQSPLTDINVGSVTRTVGEAIGREIATVYQQINAAYLAGFIDTAKGKSLDLVVSILGIRRKTNDFAVGRVTFFRDPSVAGSITIREGVLLTEAKGDVSFQTTQLRTLQQGQVRIDVPIRATDDFREDAQGVVEAGAITNLAQPIAGIARVTNFDPTFLGADDESDEELRARAKAALRAQGKGTIEALRNVIAEERAELGEIWDPNGPVAKQARAGEIIMLIEAEPERLPSVQTSVEQTRAAGVRTTLVTRYIYFKPRVVVEIEPALTGAGKEKVIEELISGLQAHVDGLTSGEPVAGKTILETMQKTKDVKEVQIVDVITWRSDIGQPNAESLVDAIVDALIAAPPDDAQARRAAVQAVVLAEAPLPPSGRRIPDRSLVQGADGKRATDEALESGEFSIVAKIGDDDWWVVLDMEPADVLLEETS